MMMICQLSSRVIYKLSDKMMSISNTPITLTSSPKPPRTVLCLKWTLRNNLKICSTVLPGLTGLRSFPSVLQLLAMKMMWRSRRLIPTINWSRNWTPSAGEVFSKPRPLRRGNFCPEFVTTLRTIRATIFSTTKSRVQAKRQRTIPSENFQGCQVVTVMDIIRVKYRIDECNFQKLTFYKTGRLWFLRQPTAAWCSLQ